jgi:septal ring factor EnvC (AmiA/AmiB activator)
MPQPDPIHIPDPENITEERAARRYHQIRRIERDLVRIDKRITDAKTKLQTLKDEREGIMLAMLASARDEGTLPLFEDLP